MGCNVSMCAMLLSAQACVPDTETGLAWSDDGKTVLAKGTNADPSYYTFTGTYSTATEVSGSIIQPTSKDVPSSAGTWTATKGAVAPPSRCAADGNMPFIWPLPAQYTNGNTTATVSPPAQFLAFFAHAGTSPFLDQAFARYAGITFPHVLAAAAGAAGDVAGIDVTVASLAEDYPQLADDETYTLTVPVSGRATLTAATVFGALHGLETFSQLVTFDFDTQTYVVAKAPWSITDSPRFPHRGLMVTTRAPEQACPRPFSSPAAHTRCLCDQP